MRADQIEDFEENLKPCLRNMRGFEGLRRTVLRLGYKMCPGCYQPVMKDNEDDCDHIFCSRLKQHLV